MLIKTVFIINIFIHTGLAEREHKVHNIILYPERHSWCQTTPIQQVVALPGYEPVTINNNVCVGACYSYSIPSTQPAEPGELIGPYCDSCQPAETKCYHVTLHATNNDNAETVIAKTFKKRVQIIMKCSCMSCDKIHQDNCELTGEYTVELPKELFSNGTEETISEKLPELINLAPDKNWILSHLGKYETPETINSEEVPELLHFAPNKKSPPTHIHFDANNTTNELRYELNSKLINLLKSIQNEGDDSNINYDKDQLKELLKIIEGSENKLSDKNLMEFVNFVNVHNSEDLELDLSKLKEVLTTFRKDQNILEHSDFGLGQAQKNNADIESDLKKYSLPIKFGVENVPSSQLKSSNEITDDVAKNSRHHKHYLGEEVHMGTNVGHLVIGPHGSKVVTPDIKVEKKLEIESDVLKPNHPGVVISYENHNKNNNNN